MMGEKDADQIRTGRQQFRKERVKSIYELQRIQREMDRDRLKIEPDARLRK